MAEYDVEEPCEFRFVFFSSSETACALKEVPLLVDMGVLAVHEAPLLIVDHRDAAIVLRALLFQAELRQDIGDDRAPGLIFLMAIEESHEGQRIHPANALHVCVAIADVEQVCFLASLF